MNEAIERYLKHCKVILALSTATLEAYANDLGQFEAFARKPLDRLTSDDIYAFLAQFDNKRTLNRKLSAINHFLNWCYDTLLTDESYKLKGAKVPINLPKYLTEGTIEAALKAIDRASWIGLRDYALIVFLYASGCRISEALKAQKQDIEEGWLRVRYGKGEKERLVPIAARALLALDEYLSARTFYSPLLFINYKGAPLSRIFAFRITRRALGVSPHALRHSFATSLIIGGADLRIVQELLGHSSLNTTQIYTHLEKPLLYESVQRYHPLAKSAA
ncbi:MAG: tyrosine-type recombinase/integrase [Helicobacteraceae bacterium]|jgi:integrase/recombinase XerD|nr:tyrosine-type recombinase/integrase [Helicobacteraceae bacterium]